MADETPRRAAQRKNELDPLQWLARRHRWVLTTEEMLEGGLSRHVIARHAREGTLVRQHHGVYLVGRTKPTRAERDLAAVKACGKGAVLSHRSAAARWGILRHHTGPAEVTARTQRRRRPGLIPHQADLDPQDVTIKDGIPITTLARTLIDLAGSVAGAVLEVAIHEAQVLKRLHVPTIDRAAARAGRRRGMRALRRHLQRHRPVRGDLDGTRLERKFLRFLRDYGLPPAQHGAGFDLEDGEKATLDVFWPKARVGVELDGGVHQSARHFRADRRKSRRIEALHAVTVVRVTDEDVDVRPAELARDILALLAREAAAV